MISRPPSPSSSPEINPLTIGDLGRGGGSGSDGSTHGDDSDVLAPLPEYKAAGELQLTFDGLLKPAVCLRLHEDLAEGCGGQTWPAGMVLTRHLLRHRRAEMARARILELGAGGGLVGLAVALSCRGTLVQENGAVGEGGGSNSIEAGSVPDDHPVYITDQEPMLALMQRNIQLNGLEDRAKAQVLNWGDPLPAEVRALRPTVVLAADCVYFEPAFPLLLATLAELLEGVPASGDGDSGSVPTRIPPADPVTVYFCFKKRRRADMHFLKQAQKRFCMTELADDDRPVFSRQGLFLYAITRKEKKNGTQKEGRI